MDRCLPAMGSMEMTDALELSDFGLLLFRNFYGKKV